jgi:CDP-paratose 2-epimerase
VELCGAVEAVVDAAANASVLAGLGADGSSRQLVENNLLGTINLLEHCRRHQAAFVLLSTSRVYSIPPLAGLSVESVAGAFRPNPINFPGGMSAAGISESFSTASPVSLYGSTKLGSEQIALEYGHAFQFPLWINRCGVMAGAGQFGRPDQGIFAYWLHSWRERRPLKYIGFDGLGSQVRDCLHPGDLVPLIDRQVRTPNDARSPIVNLSGGIKSARSLAQLSQFCTHRWGSHPIASDPTPRAYDLPWVVLDPTQAERLWRWTPSTTVDVILEQIADFADTQPNWLAYSL